MKTRVHDLICALVLTLCCGAAHAQWRHTVQDPLFVGGSTHCIAMGVDANGNVDALFQDATTANASPVTFVIAQYSQAGAKIWERTGPSNCTPLSLLVQKTGDIYITAEQTSSTPAPMLFHLASDGTYLFARTYIGVPFGATPIEAPGGVVADSNGNISIALGGQRLVSTNTEYIAVVMKVNSNGFPMWTSSYTGTGGTALAGIATDSAGNVIFEGTRFASASSLATSSQLTGMFASGTGQLVWTRQYHDSVGGADLGQNLVVDTLSGAIFTVGSARVSATVEGVVLQKLDDSGQVFWRHVLSDGPFDLAVYPNIAIDANDDVFIAGSQNGQPGIAQFDANGDFRWLRRYALPAGFISIFNNNSTSNLVVTKSGNAILDASMVSTANGGTSYLIVLKYSPTGDRLSADFAKAPTGFDILTDPAGLASDLSGHIDWIADQFPATGTGFAGVIGQFP
ncbi:MAG: hypothetical protein KGJ62_10835 [Armatimonadetes bacterium]|nr:hypothetical protein [Armatimonadota bacterium]MDE2206744.1 hypothetical protein [Armatimonadota bacterium]